MVEEWRALFNRGFGATELGIEANEIRAFAEASE